MNSSLRDKQIQVVIALLARSTIGVDYIDKVVRSGKKKGDPEKYVEAYNRLDGSSTGTELAAVVGVSQQAMSGVLQTWEEEGIVYETGKSGRYAGLLKLPTKAKRTLGSRGTKASLTKRQENVEKVVASPSQREQEKGDRSSTLPPEGTGARK